MAKEKLDNERPHVAETMRGKMEKIISLCKRRGFVYPSSEIYGGFANSFDYGPLGAQLKKNIKDIWWQKFVTERDDMVGLDSAIIQNPKVWEASGHLKSFSDPLVECKKCHRRFREDHVNELLGKIQDTRDKKQTNSKSQDPNNAGTGFRIKSGMTATSSGMTDGLTQEQREMLYCNDNIEHDFTEAKEFNLMFKTFVGVTEDSTSVAYLRPETAQGIFINFQNVMQSTRVKLPFGIAQIGKAFRNEITPGNFIFRTREFEQAEIEYFIKPDKEESKKWYEIWIKEVEDFYLNLGIKKENISIREHAKEELSHYSAGTSDIEYKFPFGISELAGVAQRTDYDLKAHKLEYFNEETGEKLIPYVVEPSMGIDRAALAFLVDAYDESDGKDGRAEGEVTLHLDPKLAPIKVAVFPLMKKEGQPEMAKEIAASLRKVGIATFYDEGGSVGKRYRRQDEVGTPWCITVDFDSIKDKTVTVRDRDTMKQERIEISKIVDYISNKLK